MDYIKTLPLPPPRCRSAPHQLPPASAVCSLRAMYDTIPPQILLKEIKEEECGTKNDRTDIAAYCNIAVVVPAGSHLVGYFFGRKAL